jgi:hypothetical protein
LAEKMVQHNLITYQIEAMHPSWLTDNAQYRLYRLFVGLSASLLCSIFFGLLSLTNGMEEFGFSILIGLILGLSSTLVEEIFEIRKNKVNMAKWSWEGVRENIRVELFVGLFFGLMMTMDLIGESFIVWILSTLLFTLFSWFIIVLFCGLSGQLNHKYATITMVDTLKWSWESVREDVIRKLSVGLFFGVVFGLIVGLSERNLIDGIAVVLVTFLGVGFSMLLFSGLKGKQIEETSFPGQRFRQTLQSALLGFVFFCLLGGLLGGVFFSWGFWLAAEQNDILFPALIFGIFSGLLNGLVMFGGLAIIKHYMLRYFIVQNTNLPWQLISFLETASKHIFLHRVGGSYTFIHRTLMEHFAEMDVERIESSN